MRHLLCQNCGGKYEPGTRMIYAAAADGPAEYERIVRGVARVPDADGKVPGQRVVTVYSPGKVDRVEMAPGYYNCDLCCGPIHPGTAAVARTVWSGLAPATWEHDYLVLPA